MSKIHYVDSDGIQGCHSKPWWNDFVDEPGVYIMDDGHGTEFELHADPLPTSSNWNEVTCKWCLKRKPEARE